MKVELKNSVFVITGSISFMMRYDAEAAIKDAGGLTARKVTKKTDYLIIGKKPGGLYTQAKNMGIPILTEEELEALLAGESVEVEALGEAGERGVDELLGEVRSVMQSAPTPQMWSALMELVDACRAEDVHVLTEYIDGCIARWTEESMEGLDGAAYDVTKDREDPRSRQWFHYRHGVMGELRVAPEHWVGEMQQGIDSPKYRLVRALDLGATKMTSAAVVKVMNHPALKHLERLILPERTAPSRALVTAICAHERLVYLNLGQIDASVGGVLVQHSTTPMALRELDLSNMNIVNSLKGDEKICEFLHASCFDAIDTLHIRGSTYYDLRLFEQAAQHDLLPSVRHLTTMGDADVTDFLCAVLPSPWTQAHITHLKCKLSYAIGHEERWRALLDIDYGVGRLEVWDLSALLVSRDRELSRRLLVETLPGARLLERVDTLVVGELRTDELVEALALMHPDLEVV